MAAARDALGRVPMVFEENHGQAPEEAAFVARGRGSLFLVERTAITAHLAGPAAPKPSAAESSSSAPSTEAPADSQGAIVRMSFEGANPKAQPEGVTKLPGRVSYFVGADSSTWHTDLTTWSAVAVRQLYPGVDLRVRSQGRQQIEYDLEFSPQASIDQVVVHCEGAAELSEDGDALIIRTPVGVLRQEIPGVWEVQPDGTKSEVACRFRKLGAGRFGFEAPGRDPSLPLVIDPTVYYSTFVGGGSSDDVVAAQLDSTGIFTIAGHTGGNFPSTTGIPFPNGGIYVIRVDPNQCGFNALTWSVIFAYGTLKTMVATPNGLITLAGVTWSTLPTANPYQANLIGGGDVFLAQLNPNATGPAQISWCTYFGSTGAESVAGMVVDSSGVVIVAGSVPPGTGAFPTTPNAYQITYPGGTSDVFLAKFDPTLMGVAQLRWSTLYGGTGTDTAGGVGVDASGRVTVVGQSYSTSLPLPPAPTPSSYAYRATPVGNGDAFVARFDPGATGTQQLTWTTWLGGGSVDSASAVAVEPAGPVVVTGWTSSGNFPMLNAFDTSYNGAHDLFVTRFDPSLSGTAQLTWSTYVGGSGNDDPYLIALDATCAVTVVGTTVSTNFPTTLGSLQPTAGGGTCGSTACTDGFLLRLDPFLSGANQLIYSSYVGGSSTDVIRSLAAEPMATVTIGGQTLSTSFPLTTPCAVQTGSGGGNCGTVTTPAPCTDGFVMRLDLLPTGAATYGTSSPGGTGPLPIGITSIPQVGNANVHITCARAPANTIGLFALTDAAFPLNSPWHPFPMAPSVSLWINPFLTGNFLLVQVPSNAKGVCHVPAPIPALASLIGLQLYAQFMWPDPSIPVGVSASSALHITIQP